MKYLITLAGLCMLLASCGSQPVHNTYNYRVYEAPSSSSSPSKVGGGGTRYVGGSDSAESFRATTKPN